MRFGQDLEKRLADFKARVIKGKVKGARARYSTGGKCELCSAARTKYTRSNGKTGLRCLPCIRAKRNARREREREIARAAHENKVFRRVRLISKQARVIEFEHKETASLTSTLSPGRHFKIAA